MPHDLRMYLREYIRIVKGIYGDTLNKIVLFGSYARGDVSEDSDIDIMIFLDVNPQDERDNINELMDATFDFNLDKNIDIQPIPKSNATFKKWENVLPFYQAVSKDGVVVYER